jgi:hypothetical protein
MHRSLPCSEGMLVSSQLGTCGPPSSLELAPSSISPRDGGPTHYAHATMTNGWNDFKEES